MPGRTKQGSRLKQEKQKPKGKYQTLRKYCKKISLNVNCGLRRTTRNRETLEYKLHHVFWKQDIVVNNIQKMLLSGHSRAEVIGLEEALEMRKEGRVSV